jgi:hypothetical protein
MIAISIFKKCSIIKKFAKNNRPSRYIFYLPSPRSKAELSAPPNINVKEYQRDF